VTYSAAAVILLILATNPFPSRRGALDLALPVTPLPVLRCMASFMMGAVMWRVSTYAPVRRLIASPLVELGLGVTILVLMGWANTDLAVVMLFPPFILCLSFEAGHISRTLASAPFYATGVISYSLYLLQVPLIVLRAQSLSVAWIQRILSPWGVLQGDAGRLVLFYAILFGCSGLTWLLIEQPARKLFHRLSGHAYSA
jgi:peptidoglycan/LPS O-acetylase OafA/YrhL